MLHDPYFLIATVLSIAGLSVFLIFRYQWSRQARGDLNYEPRGDRVIVQRLEPPAPKEGEIILPKSQQKQLNEGIVIAVGPGVRNRVTGRIDPVHLEPGDHIHFVDYAGFDIEVDGVKYVSMRDEEIHGRHKE